MVANQKRAKNSSKRIWRSFTYFLHEFEASVEDISFWMNFVTRNTNNKALVFAIEVGSNKGQKESLPI